MFINKMRHSIIWVGKQSIELIKSLIYARVWNRRLIFFQITKNGILPSFDITFKRPNQILSLKFA